MTVSQIERPSSGSGRRREAAVVGIVWLAFVLGGMLIAGIVWSRAQQLFIGVALLGFLVVVLTWLRYPLGALAATVGLSQIGDLVTISWFPFNKNLSSRESILFINDSVSLSPLELSVALGLVVSLYRQFAATGRLLPRTPLMRPMTLFGVFLVTGLIRGIASGGWRRAALFELRPVLLLLLVYVLLISVCRTRRDFRVVFSAALVGLALHACLSLQFLSQLSAIDRDGLESLVEHGAAIGMNFFILFFLVALLLRKLTWRLTFLMVLGLVPMVWVYLVSQRRAAVVALGAAFLLLGVVLWWEHRRTFWLIVPAFAVVVVGYLGAFWSADGSVGFPAQAVKAVLAPDDLSAADASSNLYREIEKFNLSYTIKDSPIVGQGFGKPFLRPLPLPDINFEFQEYLPHNSVLWLWIKTGFFGFATFVYLIAKSIMIGVARIRRMSDDLDRVIMIVAVLFIVMFSVYLYVEIGWESRNVVLLALSMAIVTAPTEDSGAGATKSVLTERSRVPSPSA